MLDKEKNKGEPSLYLRSINVRWGNFKLDDLSEMRVTEAEKQQFNILDGDLLICEGGEPGRCAVWTGGDNDLAFQKALIRVRPFPGILSNWIAKFLMFEEQQGDLENYFTGTTIKPLPAVSLAKVPLLVPPLAEQRRIIAKIDSLLARSVRAR